jgi:hypothetical protein
VRNNKTLIALFVIPVVITAGIYVAARYTAPATDHAIQHTPSEAFFYSSLFLKPSTNQRKALRDLLARVPSAGTPDESTAALDVLLNDALSDFGLRYTDDIKPWVGTEIAFWATPPEEPTGDLGWGLMIATEDEELAREAIAESDAIHDGTEQDPLTEDGPNAFVEDGFVTLMNRAAQGPWKGMHEEGAETLGQTSRYNDAIGLLREDRVALAYFDPVPLFEGLPSEQVQQVIQTALGPWGTDAQSAVAYLRDDAIVLESASPRVLEGHGGSLDPQRGLLEEAPKVAWGAGGLDDLGTVLRTIADAGAAGDFGIIGSTALRRQIAIDSGLDLDTDVFDWMGDAGFFIMGGAEPIVGGAIIESTDPETSLRAIRTLGGSLRLRGVPVHFLDEPLEGFWMPLPGVANPLYVAIDPADPKRVVVAVDRGPFDRWLQTSGMVASEDFQNAVADLGEGYATGMYFDPGKILDVLEAAGFDGSATFRDDIAPNIEVLTHLVGGSRVDGDTVYRRLVIGVK